jgi:hypothetical protein
MKKPFHPFLISAYFVLALLGLNIEEVKASAAYRSLGLALLAAGLLWGILRLVGRDWDKAAILASVYLTLFFTYGHVYSLLKPINIMGLAVGRHRLLIPLWCLLAVVITWLVFKKVKNLQAWHGFLNTLSIVALLFPLYQVTSFEIRTASQAKTLPQSQGVSTGLRLPAGQQPPDIYYIILDAYPRGDTLQKQVGFDNSAFLNQLKEIGFYVADCSQSNYSQTALSVASSLNYNYLEALGNEFVGTNADKSGVLQLLKHSAAHQELKALGYSFITFESPYYWLRIPDSDYYFSPEKSSNRSGENLLPVNSFEAMLLRESAAVILTDSATLLSRFMLVDMDYPNKDHRENLLYIFDKLRQIPLAIPGPKLIYAHIISPHTPLIFGPNGEYVHTPSDAPNDVYNSALADQITYLNKRVLSLVREIIAVSATPPVIVIQGDHGDGRSSHADRVTILNAYYLPNGGDKLLYPTITPVNTFRVIFDAYFGGQLSILEDRSYYSAYDVPYVYTFIPNTCQANK